MLLGYCEDTWKRYPERKVQAELSGIISRFDWEGWRGVISDSTGELPFCLRANPFLNDFKNSNSFDGLMVEDGEPIFKVSHTMKLEVDVQ
jgi:hypothetical protein